MSGTAIAFALVAGVATFVVGMLVARPIIYWLAGREPVRKSTPGARLPPHQERHADHGRADRRG